MSTPQPGILAPLPPLARCLTFQLSPDGDPTLALAALAEWTHGDELVVGIGQPLALALNAAIPGLRGMDAPPIQYARTEDGVSAYWMLGEVRH